jgi:hypothetical protein
MSESTSAPAAAPAEAPAPVGPDTSAPPPASQPSLSLSEAARALARRRAEVAAQPRQEAPQRPAQAMPPAAPTESTPDAFDALAKALGAPQVPAPADAAAAAAPVADALEIEGQRYSREQLAEAVRQSADYTKKTQALAEAQRELASQREALATVLPHIQPELQALSRRLEGAAQPDASLIETNPQEYLRQLAAWQAAAADHQRLGQVSTMQQQAMERAQREAVEAGNRALAEKYDFWRDEAQRTSVQRNIAEWAMNKAGYSRNELMSLADPKHVETMMKAMMWDRMAEGAKTAAPAPRHAAPARGAPPPPAASQQIADADARFAEAPSIRNAAALLSARRAGNGRFN